MGGGGFAQHAAKVVAANRALLKKRTSLKRKDYIGERGITRIKIRKATPAQLKAVRERLKADKRREFRVWVFSAVLTVLVLFAIYLFFVS
ncbi:hypothetical protein [Poritiphilus flavus]|uniref:Uncharacterized protein n=1 Tax=Poritiphilus flavus TaxID=2697053 RepID=A0A6L9EFF4_9FLAO|nr:hypothetical protein [Poritiphilus flavus]NAS13510.1 hypothetical protein [Poritiphilus flavus]